MGLSLTVSADLDSAGYNGPISFPLLRHLPVIPLQKKIYFLSDKGPLPDQKVGATPPDVPTPDDARVHVGARPG